MSSWVGFVGLFYNAAIAEFIRNSGVIFVVAGTCYCGIFTLLSHLLKAFRMNTKVSLSWPLVSRFIAGLVGVDKVHKHKQ